MNQQRYQIAVLGLKNKKTGEVHVYEGNSVPSAALVKGEPRKAKFISVFPYDTFSSLSSIDRTTYDPAFLSVEADITGEEYKNLSTGSILAYRLPDKEIVFEHEISPWHYASTLLGVLDERRRNGVTYELLVWQAMLPFQDADSFDIYWELFTEKMKGKNKPISSYKFSLTPDNEPVLKELLARADMDTQIDLHYYKDFPKKGLEGYSAEEIATLVLCTSEYTLQEIPGHLATKEVFDALVKKTDGSILRSHTELIPPAFLKEYDPDAIFRDLMKNVNALYADSDYTPYSDYDGEYEYTYDDRDDEIQSLEPILPHVTEASLPLLRRLDIEKIGAFLDKKIYALIAKTEPLAYSQSLTITFDHGKEERSIIVQIVDGKVEAVVSPNCYIRARAYDRSASDVAVDRDLIKKDYWTYSVNSEEL